MILIISDKSDVQADRVESILRLNAAEYSRLNLDIESLKLTKVKQIDNTYNVESPSGWFSTNKVEVVWNRSSQLYQMRRESDINVGDNYSLKAQWNKTLDELFASLESTKWLNFYNDACCDEVYMQYSISKKTGLKWPSYVCSSDINYLNTFFEMKRERVLGLMKQKCNYRAGGSFSATGKTSLDSNVNEVFDVKRCPDCHAAYLVRCTVVGMEYFVGKITSVVGKRTTVNGKYYAANEVVQPPRMIKERAIEIMNELHLTHGVFDFIVTDREEWYFDALNPTNQYEWIEDMTGSDISQSIAKWLMSNN